MHFGFVRPALEVRTETDLHLLGLLILSLSVSSWIIGTCLRMLLGTLATSSMTGTCGTFTIFCSLDVRNIFVCTFGSAQPLSGYWICSFCTTGTSTNLSVSFHNLLCVFEVRKSGEELARFRHAPQLAHQRTRRSGVLVLLRRFSAPSALTSACSRCSLITPHGFSGRLGLLKSACVTQHSPCQCAASPVCLASRLVSFIPPSS